MQRNYILVLFAIFLNVSAANAGSLRDSIGVENQKGKKVILHQIVAKDTYYSVGRRYNISPKVIMTYNDNKFLSLGVVIKVPTEIPFTADQATPISAPVTSSNRSATTPGTYNKPATAPVNGNSNSTAATVNSSNKPTADQLNSPPQTTSDTTLIEHAVQRKENLNMLAEKYGTTVNEIKRASNLRSINLQIGQILKIPATKGLSDESNSANATGSTNPTESPKSPANTNTTSTTAPVATTPGKTAANTSGNAVPPSPAQTQPVIQVQPQYKKSDTSKKPDEKVAKTIPAQPVQPPAAKEEFVVHTVAGNETMYSIATKYNLTLDQLKAKNNLTTNSLYVGQKLLISGQYPAKSELSGIAGDLETDSAGSVNNPSLRLPPSRYGLSQMDEKGTGMWILDQDLDSSKMLVLHRTAPVGTIMKITNPMSNRSTFAKVIGKFTENQSTKDVIIVMTKAVADALGALDKRFLCTLTYSGQANEQ